MRSRFVIAGALLALALVALTVGFARLVTTCRVTSRPFTEICLQDGSTVHLGQPAATLPKALNGSEAPVYQHRNPLTDRSEILIYTADGVVVAIHILPWAEGPYLWPHEVARGMRLRALRHESAAGRLSYFTSYPGLPGKRGLVARSPRAVNFFFERCDRPGALSYTLLALNHPQHIALAGNDVTDSSCEGVVAA